MHFAYSSGNAAQRLWKVDNNIKAIYHYHDENLITVNGVTNTSINEEYYSYFVIKDLDNNKTEIIISGDYSSVITNGSAGILYFN